jgi:hypothetical protein
MKEKKPEYVDDLHWVAEQKKGKKFILLEDYEKRIGARRTQIDESFKVTLEISVVWGNRMIIPTGGSSNTSTTSPIIGSGRCST